MSTAEEESNEIDISKPVDKKTYLKNSEQPDILNETNREKNNLKYSKQKSNISEKIYQINKGSCILTLNEHKDKVYDLQILKNGDLISCSKDGTIKFWKTGSQTSYKTIQENNEPIYKINLFEDKVVTSHNSGLIKYWDKNGALRDIFKLCHKRGIDYFVVTENEIISVGWKKEISVLDLKTKNIEKLEDHKKSVLCVELLENNIVTGSQDHTVKIWFRNQKQEIKTLEGHRSPVTCLKAFGNNKIVSGSEDGEIKLWNIQTGTCEKTFNGHEKSIKCLEILGTNEIVSGSLDKTIKIWNMETGECTKTIQGHSGGVLCLKVLETGEIISGSEDKTIKIWH